MLYLDGHSLTIEDVAKVARNFEKVGISLIGYEQLKKSRKIVENVLKEEKPVYGISTINSSNIHLSLVVNKINQFQLDFKV